MITIEKLRFIKEEVILSKLIETETAENKDVFANSTLPQDKSDYVLYEVVKIGEKQKEVKIGDKVLVSEQIPQEIKIRGQAVLENYKKLINETPIFAIVEK